MGVDKTNYLCHNKGVDKTKASNNMTRYTIFNSEDISMRGFETEEEANSKCKEMEQYHSEKFYVKKVVYNV